MKDNILLLLFIVFVISFIAQVVYLLINTWRLAGYKVKSKPLSQVLPVSVLISARNEYQNLVKNLPLILKQDYPDFEVVVIDDRSYDGSDELLTAFANDYPNLKVVSVAENERYHRGKKFALTLGIKAAKNEYLLLTDADCEPASNQWIKTMVPGFDDQTQIVLGYSPYIKKNGLLNAFIRFETLRTATSYLSAALRGKTYMGLGRNLAYTKTLFFKNKGFATHMHLMAGDDDLFVNQNATGTNVNIEISPDAHMYTEAKQSFGAFYKQKRRHMGVGKYYKGKHRRFLSFDALSGFFYYGTFIALVCLLVDVQLYVVLGIFALRLLLQLAFYHKVFKKLGCADLFIWLPFFDFFYYLYLNVFGLIGTFTKTEQWK